MRERTGEDGVMGSKLRSWGCGEMGLESDRMESATMLRQRIRCSLAASPDR